MKIELPTSTPGGPSELFEAAERSHAVAVRAEALRDTFYKKAEALREEVAQQFAGMDMDNATKQALIRQQLNKRMADLQREHMEDANKVLKDIGADVELMNNSAPIYESKLRVLSRITLSSPERATYNANLANAGPVELAVAAQQALMSGDKALATAVASRVQALPRESRPFDVHAFCNRFDVQDFDRAHKALGILRSATTRAINAQREIRNPSSRLVGRILNSILKPASEREEE